jgi:hypothetical protein
MDPGLPDFQQPEEEYPPAPPNTPEDSEEEEEEEYPPAPPDTPEDSEEEGSVVENSSVSSEQWIEEEESDDFDMEEPKGSDSESYE